jgi:hypothetical protein
MRGMRRILLAVLLVLAACGPALPPARPLGTPGADPDEDIECKDERTTGTNMSRSVCLTREQQDENRRAAKEWAKHPRNDTGQPHK